MEQVKSHRIINLKDRHYIIRLVIISILESYVFFLSNISKIEGQVGSILGMAIFWAMVIVIISTIRYEEKNKYWFLSLVYFLLVLFVSAILGAIS